MQEDGRLIYSPTEHIPIGKAVVFSNGVYGISFKWKRKNKKVTETITLDKLFELVIMEKMHTDEQRTP